MAKSTNVETPFRFDAARSVEDNIQRFLTLLQERDPALAPIFRQNIAAMLPLPADGQARLAVRLKFSSAVAKAVDALDVK